MKKPITFLSIIIALAFLTMSSSSDYVVLLLAQPQQPSSNTQKTNGTLSGHNVSILPQVPADRSFSPNVINTTIGDIVTWTNHDVIPHTVTSGTGPSDPNKGKEFDSGLSTLQPGKMFSHKFTGAGEFPYFCQLHPAMTGKVIVA